MKQTLPPHVPSSHGPTIDGPTGAPSAVNRPAAAPAVPSGTGVRRADRTATLFLGVLLVGLVALFARVVQLQVAPSEALGSHLDDRTSTRVEPARRGDFLDARGRLIAATRFGYRVFVDPADFPNPPDAAIINLATTLGVPVEELGPKIIAKMVENERRRVAAGLPAVEPTGGAGPGAGKAAPAERERSLSAVIEKLGDRLRETGPAQGPALVRYVPIPGVIDDAKVDLVKKLKIPGVHLEFRGVREVCGDDFVAPLLGKVGTDDEGLMGAERTYDERVRPVDGRITYVRDSSGRPLWIEPGGYTPPQRGEDVRLAIDLELQRIAVEELERGIIEADAAGGRVVVMNPHTGEIVAMADVVREPRDLVEYGWDRPIPKDNSGGGPRYRTIRVDRHAAVHPALARNRCVEDVYEPGSTFKPFVWAAVTELGLARPEEVIDTGGGTWTTPYGRTIHDVVKKGLQTWSEVLVNSSNIGMAKGTSRLSPRQMHDAVMKFGFGKPTGTRLAGEASGLVTSLKDWKTFTHTSVAMGHEVAVTPVQMVRAFCVFARVGEDAGTLPQVRLLGADDNQREGGVTRRVIPRATAELVRNTLRGVTANLDRRMTRPTAGKEPEQPFRYELFGKSGTAEIPLGPPPEGKRRPKGSDGYFNGQYNSSFIAAGPVENPRLAMIVVIDDPGPAQVRSRQHYGAIVGGPVVRRTMERSLKYLGVPASPPPAQGVVIPHAE